ncbi:MAG TPA: hypothetical protein VEB87_02420 [Nitrososphaerales archaeon]|nr:hypothetical protein [Nitrososphaerales archaeon]
MSLPSREEETLQGHPVRKGITVLIALILVLALASGVLFYEYEAEVTANAQASRLQNGIPTVAVSDCIAKTVFFPVDFYPLVPEAFRNMTIAGGILVTYSPTPLNSTSFKLYEVWSVAFFPANKSLANQPVSTFPSVDLVRIANCSLTG